jgi:hypothetical protein
MIHLALVSLHPTAKWILRENNYESLEWLDEDISKPSKEQVETEIIRLQVEYDANKYQRDRKPEYPPIGDQLDALWKGGDAATEMLAKVQAVKEKYPKPE